MADFPYPSAVKARRNGKSASCEQCRKRKLACDHAVPICGRCQRRGIADCYYHPAPLTKTTTTVVKPVGNGRLAEPRAELLSPPRSNTSPSTNQHTSPEIRPQYYYAPSVGHSRRTSTAPATPAAASITHPSGFLGLSSSSAVVAELNGSLGLPAPDLSVTSIANQVSEADIVKGADILRLFFDPDLYELISRYGAWRLEDRKDGFILFWPIYAVWQEGIQYLKDSNFLGMTPNEFSAQVWRNTQRVFPQPNTKSAQEWADQGAGVNLRWEAIGIMLCKVGLVFSDLAPWAPALTTKPNGAQHRGQIMTKMLAMTNTCLQFTQQCEQRSDLSVILMYYRMLLAERCVGDTLSEAWYNMGAICDAVVVLGFHQPKKADADTPFFLCELRIRLFNRVYNHDKFLAEFLGRPPRISYRHCSFQEVLDLGDEDICADDETRNKAIAALRDGWGSGPPSRTTWLKAFYTIFLLREDILEIALGPHVTNLESRVAYVRAEIAAAREAMPACARVDPEQLLKDIRHVPQLIPGCDSLWKPVDVMNLVLIHVCCLRADFLLERAIVSRQKADHTDLIASSYSLLKFSMATIARKDYFTDFMSDMLDVVSYHALPAASVLAIEMLKRDRLGIDDDTFPRSQVLQWLAILVPELGEVGPEDGYYTVCQLGYTALSKALETTLSRRPPTAEPLQDAQFDAQVDFSNEANFLQWLGNTDFDSTAWLDTV